MNHGPSAGWYPDPSGRHQRRWWDGARWTSAVNTDGVSGSDPAGMRTPPSEISAAVGAPPPAAVQAHPAAAAAANGSPWLVAVSIGTAAIVLALVLVGLRTFTDGSLSGSARPAAAGHTVPTLGPVSQGPLLNSAPSVSAGGVLAWGWDHFGQLGDGPPKTEQTTAVPVKGLEGDTPIVAVSTAGGNHSLLLRGDGSVLAWGSDLGGELGDGSANTDQLQPVAVSGLGPGSGVVAVSAGSYHSLALRTDGSVVAWGENGSGQLGGGATSPQESAPVEVKGLGAGSGVVAVSAGGNHSLALRADGTVLAWGSETYGQLGNGAINGGIYADQPTPIPVLGLGAGSGVIAIDAGYDHNLALRADGSILSWGDDQFGQLGDGETREGKPGPVAVSDLESGSGVVAVSAGLTHSLALRSDGSVLAWGSDYSGELGDVAFDGSRPRPVAVTGLGRGSGVVAISAGGGHSLALRSDGSVLAWGSDEYGQIGDGGLNEDQSTHVAVDGLGAGSGIVAVAAGFQHSLAARK